MGMGIDNKTANSTAEDLPSLAPFSNVATAALLGSMLAISLMLFHRYPGIDHAFSRLFFVEMPCGSGKPAGAICGSFPLGESALFQALRQFFQHLPVAFVAGLGAASIVRFRMGLKLTNLRSLQTAVAFWAYVLSVGLLVNAILKELWGRPRPIQTDIFGGMLPFVPAGEISTYCPGNCSFISGEASASAWLICLVALLPRQYADVKPAAYTAAIVLTVATALLRIAFGGHYLSDVVIGSLATLLVFSLLAIAAARYSRTQT